LSGMKKTAVLIAAMALMLISCKGQNENKIIAETKAGSITFSEFEKNMLDRRFEMDASKAAKSTLEERRSHLKDMVFEKIMFDVAEKNSIDTLKSVRDEYSKRLYNYAIVNGLVKDSIRGKIYSEDDLKVMYEKRKVKVLPKHILVDVNKRKEEPSKARIDSVYNKLIAGEKFEDLAAVYSDDKTTGVEGGVLGWVFSYELLKEFEDQILTVKKGEFTKPFKTHYGYHIALLSDERKNESLKPYEKEKVLMIGDMDKRYANVISAIQDGILAGLMVKYDVKLDSAKIKQFVKQLKKYSEQAEKDKKDALDMFSNEEKKLRFADFENLFIEASSIISALKTYPKDNRPEITGYDDIKAFVMSRFRNRMIEKYVDELGYTSRKDFIAEVKKGMGGFYKDKITNLLVRSKIEDPSEDELMKYYIDNKETFKEGDSTYKDFKKVRVSILNSLKGKKYSQSLKDWENGLLSEYGVKIDYRLLEDTFYSPEDDKK
jgi:foldase protein PrsA